LTKNGKPIIGGKDIDPQDYAFAGKIYPKPAARAEGNKHPLALTPLGGSGDGGTLIELTLGDVRLSIRRMTPPLTQQRTGGSVLERVVGLLGNPGITVTAETTWTQLGFESDGLDVFVRGRVSNAFGVALSGSDAGDTVGDLVKAINRALGN
jgi:hypothetical protein